MPIGCLASISFPHDGTRGGVSNEPYGPVSISTPTKFTASDWLMRKPTSWTVGSQTVSAGNSVVVSASYTPGETEYYNAILAGWSYCKYTATLKHNTNGGSSISNRSSSIQNGNNSISFSNIVSPTKSGVTFYGWANSSNTTTRSINPGGTATVSFTHDGTDQSKTKTIYAIWSITQTFNANGGSFSGSAWANQTKYVQTGSETFTIPANGPTWSDTSKIFAGWAKSSSATVPEINQNNSQQNVKLSENTVWYAVWNDTTTITQHFDANGGSFGSSTAWADQTQTITGTGTNFIIPAGGPTRAGYKFIGWSSNYWTDTPYIYVSTSQQTVYLTKNKTWYAIWWKTPLVEHFDANGGSFGTSTAWNDQSVSRTFSGSSDLHKTVNFTIPAGGPTRPGFLFVGWSSSPISENAEYEKSSSARTIASERDLTWYAVWTKRPVYIKIGSSIVKAYPYIKLNDEIRECYFYKNGMN